MNGEQPPSFDDHLMAVIRQRLSGFFDLAPLDVGQLPVGMVAAVPAPPPAETILDNIRAFARRLEEHPPPQPMKATMSQATFDGLKRPDTVAFTISQQVGQMLGWPVFIDDMVVGIEVEPLDAPPRRRPKRADIRTGRLLTIVDVFGQDAHAELCKLWPRKVVRAAVRREQRRGLLCSGSETWPILTRKGRAWLYDKRKERA